MSNPVGSDDTPVVHSDDEALLLIESLLHELIASGTVTIDRAIVVIEIAIEARDQIREARGNSGTAVENALAAILATLQRERLAGV